MIQITLTNMAVHPQKEHELPQFRVHWIKPLNLSVFTGCGHRTVTPLLHSYIRTLYNFEKFPDLKGISIQVFHEKDGLTKQAK